MKPLNYAILKHFTKVEEASASHVVEALKDKYGDFKALNEKEVLTALMTAEANGLLEESRYELSGSGDVVIYYRAHQEGLEAINKYIKD
ncbi:hypothetical protein PRVXT_000283 [Proteinivorax tanatarense]|uniref:Uncharacterized protein n=1 Tax=Proteinivorax tanatarense TaxID=1260629 RepID=A0AAU7VM15_9FIRM